MKQAIKKLVVAYPSGNTTAVVFDDKESVSSKQLNSAILQTWKTNFPSQTEIEQCCFITKPNNSRAIGRVEMFGGEFCGNATRSVVWLLTKGANGSGYIESSGVKELLSYEVKNSEVEVQIPLPSHSQLVIPVKEGNLVELDGICHLVVTDPEARVSHSPRELLNNLLQKNAYRLRDWPCVGVTYYDGLTSKARFCVWVKEVDTIFDETACGSGTSAIGIVLATEQNSSVSLPVHQPSGENIITRAIFDQNQVTTSFIKGTVTVLYEGKMELL